MTSTTNLHLCEVRIRNTTETIKYYEIELEGPDYFGSALQARDKAVQLFFKDLLHIPSLRKQVNERDWYVDSVKIS